MKNIIKYASGHQDTQLGTLSCSKAGVGALNNMEEKLHLAGNELLRMEDEGGIALSGKQTAKVEAYSKLARRIKRVLRRVYPKF